MEPNPWMNEYLSVHLGMLDPEDVYCFLYLRPDWRPPCVSSSPTPFPPPKPSQP